MPGDFFLQSIEALWILGLVPAEALPDIAIDALERGYESDALVELGGLAEDEMASAPSLFMRFLDNVRSRTMDRTEALRYYARIVSASILSETVTPWDGAKRIARVVASQRDDMGEFHDLDGFANAARELEARPEERATVEQAIREEAQRWLPGGA